MKPSVLAIAAHPDDIEFVMAGTMLQLVQRGWQAHYFNIANGCCGSTTLDRQQCAAVRLAEAQRAASLLPAVFYPPICDDLEVFYTPELHRRVAAVVRQARPSIILTHAPLDYMEDHQNAARLALGGAFVRAMPNFVSDPPVAPYQNDLAIYHAQPHGNREPLGTLVCPTHFVDVSGHMDLKRQLLAAHASQDQWLDATQGISAYLETMVQQHREVASLCRRSGVTSPITTFTHAEGWRRHIHLGLSEPNFDPLATALGDCIAVNS
ncbi:MAG: PIG-L family deacetylase [Pirellulaceae bacterium]|nr:PIG-L family deacetylase [Pirellulaceae bacterium]